MLNGATVRQRDRQSGVMRALQLPGLPSPVIEFEVPGEPQPQGSHQAYTRNGRAWVTSDNPRLRPWRNAVCWHAREALGERPPLTGPVRVELWFSFARPRGHFGRRGLLPSAPAGHAVRPDCDKLARGAIDALTEGGSLARRRPSGRAGGDQGVRRKIRA